MCSAKGNREKEDQARIAWVAQGCTNRIFVVCGYGRPNKAQPKMVELYFFAEDSKKINQSFVWLFMGSWLDFS